MMQAIQARHDKAFLFSEPGALAAVWTAANKLERDGFKEIIL
jgi:hypothetical protein